MTLQQELHQVLSALMQAIASGAGGIAAQVARIDRLREELGEEAPPMLRHYLEKRSYAKALEFLEGRDGTKKPNC
jgi:hypothetical protein